jgi:predicted amidohydrolase
MAQFRIPRASNFGLDLAETIRRFESLLAQSTVGRAELVVFPEAFIVGCPKGCGRRRGRPAAEGQTSSHEIPRWALSGPVHACAEVNSAALVSSA